MDYWKTGAESVSGFFMPVCGLKQQFVEQADRSVFTASFNHGQLLLFIDIN
jgi:hypothetical protein